MFITTNLIVMLSVFCVLAIGAPYQELPPRPGYVPVYIREGNTPLSQINPKLVEAFHEDEQFEQIKSEAENPIATKAVSNEKSDRHEASASNIAKFTNDDNKLMSNAKVDNETK